MWAIWALWATGLTASTLITSWLVKKHRDTLGYPSLLMVYLSYILGSNILASRIAELDLGFGAITVASAVVIFPFVAQVIDMINEIYGKKMTYFAIFLAFIANVLVSLFIYTASLVPPAPWISELDDTWRFFMLQTPRIVIASYIAFLASNLVDATVFAEIKKRVYKREVTVKGMIEGVLLRSLGTDVVNMVFDSILFFPLAFYGVIPPEGLLMVTFHGALVKVILTTLDTPWFIAFRLLTRGVRRDY
jgi:uncharacterized integral membrane protein (TIGR00697 family)